MAPGVMRTMWASEGKIASQEGAHAFQTVQHLGWNKSIFLLVTDAFVLARLTAWRSMHKFIQHVNSRKCVFFFFSWLAWLQEREIDHIFLGLHLGAYHSDNIDSVLSLWNLILLISACKSVFCWVFKTLMIIWHRLSFMSFIRLLYYFITHSILVFCCLFPYCLAFASYRCLYRKDNYLITLWVVQKHGFW